MDLCREKPIYPYQKCGMCHQSDLLALEPNQQLQSLTMLAIIGLAPAKNFKNPSQKERHGLHSETHSNWVSSV
jgi:hypothetical protein